MVSILLKPRELKPHINSYLITPPRINTLVLRNPLTLFFEFCYCPLVSIQYPTKMSAAKAAAAAKAALPDLFIVEVIIEEVGTGKLVQSLTYTAEKAVHVTVREQIMLPHTAQLPAVNPKTLYEDKVAKVTQFAVKKPEPPVKIGQIMVEL